MPDNPNNEDPDKLIAKEQYQRYIKSPAWKAKREQKFAQVGKVCRICGWTKNIEVHHITYENFGNEKMRDLDVLCDQCHQFVDGRRSAPRFIPKVITRKKDGRTLCRTL